MTEAVKWKEVGCPTCGAKAGETCGKVPLGMPWGWQRTAPHAARKQEADDEIWLNHLRPNEQKWIALGGDYPHTLLGANRDLQALVSEVEAQGRGPLDYTLFYVPSAGPLCVTPFLSPPETPKGHHHL